MAPKTGLKIYKRKFPKKKAGKRSRKLTLTKSVKTMVERMITAKDEHKVAASSSANNAIIVYNSITQSLYQYDCRQAFQAISQGAGEGNRIGNSINVTSNIVSGFIQIAGATITSNIYIRMVLLRTKADILPVNGTLNNLFNFGNNVLPPVGTLMDMIRNINKDYYTVYASRKVLLGSSDAVTSVLAMNNTMGNCFFKFDLTKHFGGKITWNDANNTPTNKAAYLIFIPCNADGTVVTTLQLAPYQVSINNEIKYTDS